MQTKFSTTVLSFTGLVFFGFCWGSTIPLTKVAVSSGHQPIGLIFWQFVFVAVIMGAVTLLRGLHITFSQNHLRYYLVIGLVGTLIPNSFSYLAMTQLPAGVMAIIIATVPMFSLLIALALGNEQFMLLRTLGIMMGVTAMILIAVPEASLPKPELAPWLLVALIAPLCYGLEANYIALRAPRDIYPIAALYGASVIGAFIAGPIAWASGHWVDLFKPWEAAEWALLGASTGHAIAYSGYMWLVGLAGVVFTSQIAYIVTAAAIASSILFLGESYSAWIWCAVFAMLGGLMLVQPVGELPRSRNV